MSKKPTLLEQAKAAKQPSKLNSREFTIEEEELCMAWLNGEITLTQVQSAMQLKSAAQPYVFLARCARQMFMKSRKK